MTPVSNHPLHRMLEADSVAFVGASNDPRTMGTIQLLNLLKGGYAGKIYPVHPREKTVLGLEAYASLRDIPDPVDLAVITVPARVVPEIIEDCGAKGIRSAVITSGGFGELGDEGKRIEREIAQAARRLGIRFIGPNCIGIINPHRHINVTMFPYFQGPGPMGLASQSGTYVTQVIPYLEEHGIGYSRAISVGNKADIGLTDCLDYLGQDPSTRAIALYIEGLKRPRPFVETAKKVSALKPIVALYVGGTEAGARSSASHTGAVGAPARLMSGLLRQGGILEAASVEELYQWAWALATQPLPRSNRVAILTHSGGPASSMADACNRQGLQVPAFSAGTREAIRPLIPATAAFGNPVDLTYSTQPKLLVETLPQILLEDPGIDGLIIHGIMVSSWLAGLRKAAPDLLPDIPLEQMAAMIEPSMRKLASLPARYGKPIICSSFIGPSIEVATRILQAHQIPTFDTPEKAVSAMAALNRYRRIRESRGLGS
ncbi:MAG: CoA-binding protein [bacterium]